MRTSGGRQYKNYSDSGVPHFIAPPSPLPPKRLLTGRVTHETKTFPLNEISINVPKCKNKQSVPVNRLCQLTLCFEFQSKSDRRKGHRGFALQMVSEVKYQVNTEM